MATSFKDLRNDQLEDIADFFVKDVVAVNPEKPTKKELLAALASGEPDSDDAPVTWEDYENIYLPAQAAPAPLALPNAPTDEVTGLEQVTPVTLDATPKDTLVRMVRDQGRYEIRGSKFTREHPFALMTEVDATYVIQNEPGFRLALKSEADEYYR